MVIGSFAEVLHRALEPKLEAFQADIEDDTGIRVEVFETRS